MERKIIMLDHKTERTWLIRFILESGSQEIRIAGLSLEELKNRKQGEATTRIEVALSDDLALSIEPFPSFPFDKVPDKHMRQKGDWFDSSVLIDALRKEDVDKLKHIYNRT